jgi:hypothetical protein
MDHILQAAKGGTAAGNLLPACTPCNRLRWHARGRRIREVLQFGLIARKAAKPSTDLGRELLRLRHAELIRKARRAGADGKSSSLDPVRAEEVRLAKRAKVIAFLRRFGKLGRSFTSAQIARATGIPKKSVRALIDTEYSVDVLLDKGQYRFRGRPSKRR